MGNVDHQGFEIRPVPLKLVFVFAARVKVERGVVAHFVDARLQNLSMQHRPLVRRDPRLRSRACASVGAARREDGDEEEGMRDWSKKKKMEN